MNFSSQRGLIGLAGVFLFTTGILLVSLLQQNRARQTALERGKRDRQEWDADRLAAARVRLGLMPGQPFPALPITPQSAWGEIVSGRNPTLVIFSYTAYAGADGGEFTLYKKLLDRYPRLEIFVATAEREEGFRQNAPAARHTRLHYVRTQVGVLEQFGMSDGLLLVSLDRQGHIENVGSVDGSTRADRARVTTQITRALPLL